MSKLFIIEAPGKRKKIQSILGPEWEVIATGGHIRELVKEEGDILGFTMSPDGTIDARFKPRNGRSQQTIRTLVAKSKRAKEIVIATDPDREGEAIAWHVAKVIKQSGRIKRVVYSEISKRAILKALENYRGIDLNLAGAALARSLVDKLVGFTGSPLLWRYVEGAKSMGRVQTPVLSILCEREAKIRHFKPETYYSIATDYVNGLKAYYNGNTGQSAGNGTSKQTESDDSVNPQDNNEVESKRVSTEAEANRIIAEAKSHSHLVMTVENNQVKKNPPKPFTTSSLQQSAGSRLKLSPDETMNIAQKLYEQGLITYHRTDSIILSEDFVRDLRVFLEEESPESISQEANKFKNKKGAQEAHEAIRPVDITLKSVTGTLPAKANQLYQLIWLRTVASQCKAALLNKSTVITQAGTTFWKAKGQSVADEGYLKFWRDLGKDTELPPVKVNETLGVSDIKAEKKQTQPPSRFTEAQMVKVMERKGIGRPSTFSPTIKTLKERGYVEVVKGKLSPTTVGMNVADFVRSNLKEIGTPSFTAEMEQHLDKIAHGNEKWQPYVCSFNFDHWQPTLEGITKTLGEGNVSRSSVKEREMSRVKCEKCGKPMAKIPSKSKKLDRPYFLKCEGCDVVKFYNKSLKQWISPGGSPQNKSEETEAKCPKCGKNLHKRAYKRKSDGKPGELLACRDCKDVVFFRSKNGVFWSKQYGEITI